MSVPDRKSRSLFKWISRVTGVDACWIEGIDSDDNPLWGIAKNITRKLWYIFSRRLRPALAVTALGGALLLPAQALQAQTSIELSSLNGANGFLSTGESGNSGLALSAGDFNNDGIEDLVIGAFGASTNDGKTYIVFGQSGGFSASIDLSNLNGTNGYILNGVDTEADNSGRAVATGDINGDGIDDVIIGAPKGDQPSNLDAGETYVVYGDELANADADDASSDGAIELANLDGTTGFVLKGTAGGDESGRAVSAGDINGDSIDDVIIGAYGANSGAGETYVVFGKTSAFNSSIDISDLSSSEGFTLNGITSGDQSGRAVAAADVNDDGIQDVIIGARNADPNGIDSGESYVVFGKTGSFGGSLDLSNLGSDGFVINGIDGGDESGQSVSSGDISGDGIDDIIIGAFHAAPNGTDSGETYVVFGKSTLGSDIELSALSSSDGFTLNGIGAYDESGYSVSSGDINNDGADDVVIGALLADPNASASGETYVVFGGSDVGSGGTIELSSLTGD
ncbi:MAG: FG-GAP repeat protein, partial [Balneolaceae bacterium]|nr:FG-GAP repeat protein [Balneolaceae bacterium]